ncbi:hypothetical protein ABZ342_00380 [Amycolatopsis sp. NPDC005961]|uniref:hypothetical protein n=1 Tax=Amycolatopsis sp. NPDC005961 TaxID=3156720 RepID=UPI0033CEB286
MSLLRRITRGILIFSTLSFLTLSMFFLNNIFDSDNLPILFGNESESTFYNELTEEKFTGSRSNDTTISYINDSDDCPIAKPSKLARTTETHVSVKLVPGKKDSTKVYVESQLLLDKLDPLLTCLNSTRFEQVERFMSNAAGLVQIQLRSHISNIAVSNLTTTIPVENGLAKVTASAEGETPTSHLNISILKNRKSVADLGIDRSSAQIEVDGYQIIGADGAPISSQNSTSVSFLPTAPTASGNVSLSPRDGSNNSSIPGSDPDDQDVPNSVLLFPLAALFPWLGFLYSGRSSKSEAHRRVKKVLPWLAIAVVTVGALTTVGFPVLSSSFSLVILLILVPILLGFASMRNDAESGRSVHGRIVLSLTIIAVATVLAIILEGRAFLNPKIALFTTTCILGGILLASTWTRNLQNWRYGLELGISCATGVILLHACRLEPYSILTPLCLIAWAAYIYFASRRLKVRKYFSFILAALTMLSFSPVQTILDNWSKSTFTPWAWPFGFTTHKNWP